MATECEFCGSTKHYCTDFRSYGGCGEAKRLADQEYLDQPEVSHWDEAVDDELEFYPDDDVDWEAPAVKSGVFKTLGQPEDVINIPNHYAKWEIEPITFVMRNKLPFAEGNVIKYTMRHRDKNGLDDIKKAIKYLKFIAEQDYGVEL